MELYLNDPIPLYLMSFYAHHYHHHTTLQGIRPRTTIISCPWGFIVIIVIIIIFPQVCCSGVFELRLKSFINDYGKDSVGQCCSGTRSPDSGACSGPCRTRFRVCLKHYQAKIDTTSPCTFGDVITPVLGENSVHLIGTAQRDGFANPIRFPFDFTWPVST